MNAVHELIVQIFPDFEVITEAEELDGNQLRKWNLVKRLVALTAFADRESVALLECSGSYTHVITDH
jgi:hypothetical protein